MEHGQRWARRVRKKMRNFTRLFLQIRIGPQRQPHP
jgi:hypothetical protein